MNAQPKVNLTEVVSKVCLLQERLETAVVVHTVAAVESSSSHDRLIGSSDVSLESDATSELRNLQMHRTDVVLIAGRVGRDKYVGLAEPGVMYVSTSPN